MAEEELSKLWEGLILTEKDDDLVKLLGQDVLTATQRGINCLLETVINERSFNKEAFHQTMPQVWKVEEGVTFIEVRDNSFIVELKNVADEGKILQHNMAPGIEQDPQNFCQ